MLERMLEHMLAERVAPLIFITFWMMFEICFMNFGKTF